MRDREGERGREGGMEGRGEEGMREGEEERMKGREDRRGKVTRNNLSKQSNRVVANTIFCVLLVGS